MRAKDLRTVWGAPDNSRLTAKQISLRLPVHVAAKIAALCEMYPSKSRTQIVGDLLAAALAEVEEHMPSVSGQFVDEHREQGVRIYEEVGEKARFMALANKHFKELEQELGNEAPEVLFQTPFLVAEDIEE